MFVNTSCAVNHQQPTNQGIHTLLKRFTTRCNDIFTVHCCSFATRDVDIACTYPGATVDRPRSNAYSLPHKYDRLFFQPLVSTAQGGSLAVSCRRPCVQLWFIQGCDYLFCESQSSLTSLPLHCHFPYLSPDCLYDRYEARPSLSDQQMIGRVFILMYTLMDVVVNILTVNADLHLPN